MTQNSKNIKTKHAKIKKHEERRQKDIKRVSLYSRGGIRDSSQQQQFGELAGLGLLSSWGLPVIRVLNEHISGSRDDSDIMRPG